MPSDLEEMAHGLRLVAVAVVSAVITATAVIGAGHLWIARYASPDAGPTPVAETPVTPSEQAMLVRTAG